MAPTARLPPEMLPPAQRLARERWRLSNLPFPRAELAPDPWLVADVNLDEIGIPVCSP